MNNHLAFRYLVDIIETPARLNDHASLSSPVFIVLREYSYVVSQVSETSVPFLGASLRPRAVLVLSTEPRVFFGGGSGVHSLKGNDSYSILKTLGFTFDRQSDQLSARCLSPSFRRRAPLGEYSTRVPLRLRGTLAQASHHRPEPSFLS